MILYFKSLKDQLAEDTANYTRLSDGLARDLRSVFLRIANDFEATMIATRQIININDYELDIVSTLRDHYIKTSRIYKNSLRSLQKAETDELAAEIDVRISQYINDHTKKQARFITDTIEEAIRKDLINTAIESAIQGERLTNGEVAKIAKDKFKEKIPARAEVIANTEITNIAGASKYAEASVINEKTEVKIVKTWITELDERARIDHILADGQTVGIDEPFIVGGEALNFPGDTSLGASIGNIINCRCKYKTEKE